jgi:hypothetical protein
LTHEEIPTVLSLLGRAVRAEVETYETIQEGFAKIETNVDEKYRESEPLTKLSVHSSQIPSHPKTEITPSDYEFLHNVFREF